MGFPEVAGLTRLTIKPRDDVKEPIVIQELVFMLDDYELHHIEGVTVSFRNDAATRAEIVLTVGEIRVDAAALPLIAAEAERTRQP